MLKYSKIDYFCRLKVMEKTAVEIPITNLNEWMQKIDKTCWRLNKLTDGQLAAIDMKKMDFLRPQGTIMLLLICKRIYEITGEPTKLFNITQSVHSYLERVDFFKFPFVYTTEKINFLNVFSRRLDSPTIIEITNIQKPQDTANFETRVKNILESWFPERASTQFSNNIATMITEICNNSLEHSNGHGKMGECYCMLQKYSFKPKPVIAIAVGDIGVGIRHHLQFTHKWVVDSDLKSIKYVIDGLSGREDGSGGMGIPFIKKTITNYSGSFSIRSGRAIVEVKDSVYSRESQLPFPGTQTLLLLD